MRSEAVRAGLAFACTGMLLLGGGARLVWLEQTRGEQLRREAQRQQTARVPIPAQRGDILDARGRVLAGSIRRPSVFADPSLLDDPRYAAYSVAPLLGLRAADLHQRLLDAGERGFLWVCHDLSPDAVRAFNEVRRQRGLRGLGIQHVPRRVYPFGRLAAHVLGFVGSDHHGLAGIEQRYDDVLAGQDGHRSATVDVRRRRLRARGEEYVAPRDGAHVVLTIDAHIQQRLEEHLRTAVEQHEAQWGAALVMDPQTGEILGMGCFPDFDPSHPIPPQAGPQEVQAALERTRNRSVADAYEPGSIFKPFVASQALQEGLVGLDDVFEIRGPRRQFGSRIISDTHPYGSLAMFEVISKSSNIGMGLLGAHCGNERLHRWVRSFGFGERTGVTLPGEHEGIVHDLPAWTRYSTQSVPIGQEISVTPIQIVAAFSVFCNGGVLYRPRIVRGVISADGRLIEDRSEPLVVRQVLDPQVAREFRMRALVEVVRNGTGQRAAISDWQVFGKTGTAQIARSDGRGYVPGAYVGSFVGGAPAHEPRAVVLVSLYRPSGGRYYGGTVAAPAVGAILADTLAYLHVPPEPPAPELPPAPTRDRARRGVTVDSADDAGGD